MNSFEPSSPWSQNTLRAPKSNRVIRAEIEPHKVGGFATNQMLQKFVEGIKKDLGNHEVSGRLECLIYNLSRSDQPPYFTVDEVTFPSAITSRWETNDDVYAYVFRPTVPDAASPTILIPSFIEGSPMCRAVTLLLVEKGWTVLEVAMPFYGKRIISESMLGKKLSERYAMLKLTPADFCQYIEQAVSDITRAAMWVSTEPSVNPERIAILGFSFAASAALTAYAMTSVLTHAICLSPPVDWAHAIWSADDQRPYLEFLDSIGVTQEAFRSSVSPFELGNQKPPQGRVKQSKIFYVENDPYTVKSAIEAISERFGMLQASEYDGSDHVAGLWPHFNTIVETTIELISSK